MAEHIIKDLAYYYKNNLEFEKILRDVESMEKVDTLQDIIGLNTLELWTKTSIPNIKNLQELLDNFPDTSRKLKKIIGKSLATNEADTWMQEYLSDPKCYRGFPQLFSDYNYWTNLSSREMSKYLHSTFAEYYYILGERKIVNKYSEEVLDGLKDNKEKLFENIRLITERSTRKKKLYFPEGFEQSKLFQGMVNSYLDLLEEKNLRDINFIETLLNFKDTNFPLNVETKSRIEQFEKNFWEEGGVNIEMSTYSVKVSIQEQESFSIDGTDITVSLDRRTLDSLEKKEILKFINQTCLIDKYGRPYSLYKESTSKTDLVGILKSKKKNEYDRPLHQEVNNMVSTASIDILLRHIKDKNLSIEKLLAHFFNEQIFLNYDIEGFSMDEIDSNLPYSSRNILLAVELESVLKQYQLLSRYDKVDLNLLNLMPPLNFSEIESKLADKYIEVSYEEIPEVLEIKSMFNGYNYICTEYLQKEDIEELKKLPSFKQYPTFFSIDEINYLNFNLNNKEYINSLGIRNAYLHGAGKTFSEAQHETNYLMLVKIFLIVISKIDEELTFYNETSQSEV